MQIELIVARKVLHSVSALILKVGVFVTRKWPVKQTSDTFVVCLANSSLIEVNWEEKSTCRA